jgi:hypothetical protein
MTYAEENQARGTPQEPPPKDAAMLVLMGLMRALHERGILPVQAVADVLDRRAINAALRGKTSQEDVPRGIAVAIQTYANLVEGQVPFVSADRSPGAE